MNGVRDATPSCYADERRGRAIAPYPSAPLAGFGAGKHMDINRLLLEPPLRALLVKAGQPSRRASLVYG
jgi:hypothetical protein